MTNAIAEEMTPVEYARTCGLTLGYVYAQIWDGRLRARKVYGRWLIPAVAVAERQARYCPGNSCTPPAQPVTEPAGGKP